MITGVGYLSDHEEIDTDTFVVTTEVVKYINEGISDLYSIKLDADNAKLYALNGPQLQVAGDFSWTLPSNFERLVSISINIAGNMYPALPADVADFPLLAANPPDEKAARYFQREGFGDGVKELYIFPSGISNTKIAYTYIPSPPALSLGTDQFHGTQDELEYVETYAAIKVAQKEESDTQDLQARRAQLQVRIRNATKDKDSNTVKRVRNLRLRGHLGRSRRTGY